ncbi:MAG TPA: hypothetical protein VJ875_03485 [Pyrinomonadaceae bacterium]|nr:hypothetical protein [Pyrinomonadaceae bacterium]
MANVVGTWSLTTDWGCDGSITGSFNQTFNSDGTWSSSPFTHSGRWYQVEGMVVWTFNDTPNLVYAANLSGSWMAGVQGYEQSGGIKGCFGGSRSGVAAAKAPSKAAAKTAKADPALGPQKK